MLVAPQEILATFPEPNDETLAGALLGRALVALIPLCVLGILAAPAIARALTAGTADPAVAAEQRELATFLLRLFIPQVLLYSYGAVVVAGGLLQTFLAVLVWPARLFSTIRRATRLMASASASDEPPYFCTTMPTGAPRRSRCNCV